MQAALINKITWNDVQEIDSILCDIDKENKAYIGEEYYSEVIRRLRTKYKTLPACRDRYNEILPIAETIVGEKNRRERTFELIVLRCMVSCKLRDEGYCMSDIARVMKYDHSTISFYFKKKEDFFALPIMYEREVRWFKQFDEELKENTNEKIWCVCRRRRGE